MIGELVGVPAEDRDDFKKWSDALLAVARDEDGPPGPPELAPTRCGRYFADLIDERRRTMRPELAPDAQPDLVSALLDRPGRGRAPERAGAAGDAHGRRSPPATRRPAT